MNDWLNGGRGGGAWLGLLRVAVCGILCGALIGAPVYAQERGALTLQTLLDRTVEEHPLIRSAKAEVAAGELDVTAAQRRRWPSISVVAESNSGNLSSTPSRALQVQQNLWDGGRVTAQVEAAEATVVKGDARTVWQKQRLALQVVAAWQALLSARDRIRLSEQTLERLQAYETQMRRRVSVNASPAIDLELVLSRTRQVEVDLASARSGLRVAARRLEELAGVQGLATRVGELPEWPAVQVVRDAATPFLSSDIDELALGSPSVQLARSDAKIVAAELDAKRAELWPTVYVRVHQPLGTAGQASTYDRNASAFLGLSYTPGAGFSTAVEADAIRIRLEAVDHAVDAANREEREALTADREEFVSSHSRIAALESAVNGSQEVLNSYSRQFTAGRKTWIDLLNAVRELSQNQFALADAQGDMTSALYRLEIRHGRSLLTP